MAAQQNTSQYGTLLHEYIVSYLIIESITTVRECGVTGYKRHHISVIRSPASRFHCNSHPAGSDLLLRLPVRQLAPVAWPHTDLRGSANGPIHYKNKLSMRSVHKDVFYSRVMKSHFNLSPDHIEIKDFKKMR